MDNKDNIDNMDQNFTNKLEQLSHSDVYPFHMPGHKRQITFACDPYQIDITEIDGFDNLHHATGIIKDLQDRYASLYQSKEAYLLVNGSSGGILSAISSAVHPGDHILMAKNSHKSVYHAAILNQLHVTYLYPEQLSYGINGSIQPKQVEDALQHNPEIKAVVITSPTYDGIISDVKSIADIVHRHHKILIVDAAHGAHFGLHEMFPENIAVYADIAIMSLHKTLPSMTQTALLTHNGDRITSETIQYYLNIYETSSPSYVLMASMQQCLSYCEPTPHNHERISQYHKMLAEFYLKVKKLKYLKIFDESYKKDPFCYQKDDTKILISTGEIAEYSGEDLMECLRKQYHIECEMAAADYVIALSSFMDTHQGLMRLCQALLEIDASLSGYEKQRKDETHTQLYAPKDKCCEIYEAQIRKHRRIPIEDAGGCVSAEFCYLYPPGIPIIVPGEVIPEQFAQKLALIKAKKMEVNGLSDYSAKTIKVVENIHR